jgi:hypothetical protein
MGQHRNNNALRMQIAYEAARILADQGGRDYHGARTKAANRLGLNSANLLPSNAEIQQALTENQRLFESSSQPEALKKLRNQAKEAMLAFSDFKPRLTGSVMDGTADSGSDIQLYLFADTPESILFKLKDLNIPWHEEDKILRYTNHKQKTHPTFLIHADRAEIRLTALPLESERHPPISPITQRPEPGITLSTLKQLIDDS